MPRFLNPPTVAPPLSRYSHGVLTDGGRRLLISGQVGLRPDGSLVEGLGAQMEMAWDNLTAVLRAADLDVTDLVKVTTFVTVPGSVGLARTVRERKLGSHAPAATYLEVAGLARPEWLVEIEGEAVRDS